MKNHIIFLLTVIIIVQSCNHTENSVLSTVSLPYYSTPDLTPRWFETDGSASDSIHTIAPFALVNQNGDTITNETFRNKVYVANFFFTMCPGICPKMNNNLQLVQKEFQNDDRLKILSHSVMPWVDSLAQLQYYAQRNEIDSGTWHLVTGPKEEIYNLARSSYFADEGFGKGLTSMEDFLHTEKVILIDRKQRIRGIYNGTLPLDIKRMIEDIRMLL